MSNSPVWGAAELKLNLTLNHRAAQAGPVTTCVRGSQLKQSLAYYNWGGCASRSCAENDVLSNLNKMLISALFVLLWSVKFSPKICIVLNVNAPTPCMQICHSIMHYCTLTIVSIEIQLEWKKQILYGEKRSIRVAVALLLCCVRNPLNSQGRSHNTSALVPQHTSATTAGPTTMGSNAQQCNGNRESSREM